VRLALLTFYPRDTRLVLGGIRMVSYNLVEALRDYPDIELHVIHCHADNDVGVLNPADVRHPPDIRHPLDRTVQDGRVTIHYLAMPRQRIVPNLVTSIGRIVREVRAVDPDLVHAHAAHFAYAGIKAGYPTIYTIHGVLPRERQIYTRTLFDRLRYGLLAYYEAYALQHVRQVVAISSHVLSAYVRADGAHPRDTSAWVRIDNPVPQAFFDLRDQAEPGRVLYAGSIDERKDLLTLLRAVERLRPTVPALRLVVAGRVNSADYEGRVRDYVAEHGLEPCVEFLGFLDREKTMTEYARCAVLALPSLEENAPMVVIEAMAAGKPVVATRVGGVPDLVQEGETGFLVPPSDDEALAQRLGQLLDDADLRARLGRRARQVCRARFHVDHVARRYYELYRRVLGT
jgi:glycosyltransferase involved in cell wall biosynthesis